MTVDPVATTVVYTDGACSGNPGPGGWAWAVAPEGEPHDSGGEPRTTNQRMELRAVIEALTSLGVGSESGPIEIVSDSTYVINCFRDGWWVKWERNGWVNSKKQPVANADLWRQLVALVNAGPVTFRWVKGHSGDRLNDLVDTLAVEAARHATGLPPSGVTNT
jgi:ribonuclease HI